MDVAKNGLKIFPQLKVYTLKYTTACCIKSPSHRTHTFFCMWLFSKQWWSRQSYQIRHLKVYLIISCLRKTTSKEDNRDYYIPFLYQQWKKVSNLLYLFAMATVTACSVVASAVVVCCSEDECLCLWSLPCLLWSADLRKRMVLPVSRWI